MNYKCTCGYECDDWEKDMLEKHYKEKHPKLYKSIVEDIEKDYDQDGYTW